MHAEIARHRAALTELCQRHRVARLEIFGSAARGTDFDPARSDVDFLVTFDPTSRNDLANYFDLQEALETLFGRKVDLIERGAIEESRNWIRRGRILAEAQAVYG